MVRVNTNIKAREPIKITLLSSMVEHGLATVEINGRLYIRRVYWRKSCGLFIRHNNFAYFEYELPLGEEVTI